MIAEGRVVGIISRADFIQALASFVRQSYDEPLVTDAQIRHHIESELQSQPWAPVGTIDVKVHDGVVDLDGVIADEAQRHGVRVLAENVAGVRTVHDHLVQAQTQGSRIF